jgi:organic radical activating enzyme
MTATVPVAEVFGPVFQGEGPHVGRVCSFLRLSGCNLSCSWCDTPYTWDWTRYDRDEEATEHTVAWLVAELTAHHTDLLILTGGEPMIHHRNAALMGALTEWPGDVHVETNGTITPGPWWDRRVTHWSVSPKLAHGGDPASRRIKHRPLAWFAERARTVGGRAAFKFVAREPADLDEVAWQVDLYHVPRTQVWIMPEGIDSTVLRDRAVTLAPHVARRGWNLTLRQHVAMYGTDRLR